MRFDLERPCRECPFRRTARQGISARRAGAILSYRGPFPCHKTVAYTSRFGWRDRGKGQACAGRLALAAASGDTHVLALARRLGDTVDRTTRADCFAAARAFVDHHAGLRVLKSKRVGQ